MLRSWMVNRRLQKAAENNHFAALRSDHQDIGSPATASSKSCSTGPTSKQLRQLLEARRARANFFGVHLFSDPAWDMLLMAYVAFLDEEKLLVATLCREGAVPATTTLRWVRALESDGLLAHRDGPLGSPQCWLEISALGRLGMERYLKLVWPMLPL